MERDRILKTYGRWKLRPRDLFGERLDARRDVIVQPCSGQPRQSGEQVAERPACGRPALTARRSLA